MTVHVEALPDSASVDDRQAHAKELGHHIKSVIGISATIDVTEPGQVERSLGKAKRVVDNRN